MRKRRKRYTWLPNWGHIGDTAEQAETTLTPLQMVVTVKGNLANQQTYGILPLLRDYSADEALPPPAPGVRYESSMADIIGSEYFLRRIVGKMVVNVEYFNPGGGTEPNVSALFPVVFVKTGIFVANHDTVNIDQPQDWQLDGFVDYGTFNVRANREPWIFQRSWILGPSALNPFKEYTTTGISDNGPAQRERTFPSSNVSYGSGILDGPHIDIKTLRRVQQQERLFWTVGVTTYPLGGLYGTLVSDPAGPDVNVRCIFDYRCLGGLRRARQRGSF